MSRCGVGEPGMDSKEEASYGGNVRLLAGSLDSLTKLLFSTPNLGYFNVRFMLIRGILNARIWFPLKERT